MPFDDLGGYTFRRFDGTYDSAGNPVFQDGDILLETVFRFKGQSAPCVILTEIDFEELDERVARQALRRRDPRHDALGHGHELNARRSAAWSGFREALPGGRRR